MPTAKTPPLDILLRAGAAEWNKLRKKGGYPKEHTGLTFNELFCADADLSGLDLVGTEWADCELSRINFRDADLSNAYFHGGKLRDCDFRGANLEGANFEALKLQRCDFTGAGGVRDLDLEDVATHDVVGLEPEDDDEPREDHDGEASVDGEPASAPSDGNLPLLKDRLPKGLLRPGVQLERVITALSHASDVRVEVGRGGTEADVKALEARMRLVFPADYRQFLMRYGQVKVIGDPEYAFGTFEIFGLDNLSTTRKEYRALFHRFSFPPGWLEAEVPAEQGDPPRERDPQNLERERTALRDALGLDDAHVPAFFDDMRDSMRIAHRHLVPLMAFPDELHRLVECVGPRGDLYTVSIKEWDVEPPEGSFTDRVIENLEQLVVHSARTKTL